MNVALRKPRMTRDQFFAWAEGQDTRYEFDGFEPVAMTGGTNDHGTIIGNLTTQLFTQLRGKPCRPMPPEGGGVPTIGSKVRYPDAAITCTKHQGDARLIPDPVIVFEVLSSGSGEIDRIHKVREYHAVASIRRYVIIEQRSIGASVLSRTDDSGDWTVTTLVAGDTLELPEVGVAFPFAELYDGTDLAVTAETGTPEGEAAPTSSG